MRAADTGLVYYINDDTQETSWTSPLWPLPGSWIEKKDSKGQSYFLDQSLSSPEPTYTDPRGIYASILLEGHNLPLPLHMDVRTDAHGYPFFVNKETLESSWTDCRSPLPKGWTQKRVKTATSSILPSFSASLENAEDLIRKQGGPPLLLHALEHPYQYISLYTNTNTGLKTFQEIRQPLPEGWNVKMDRRGCYYKHNNGTIQWVDPRDPLPRGWRQSVLKSGTIEFIYTYTCDVHTDTHTCKRTHPHMKVDIQCLDTDKSPAEVQKTIDLPEQSSFCIVSYGPIALDPRLVHTYTSYLLIDTDIDAQLHKTFQQQYKALLHANNLHTGTTLPPPETFGNALSATGTTTSTTTTSTGNTSGDNKITVSSSSRVTVPTKKPGSHIPYTTSGTDAPRDVPMLQVFATPSPPSSEEGDPHVRHKEQQEDDSFSDTTVLDTTRGGRPEAAAATAADTTPVSSPTHTNQGFFESPIQKSPQKPVASAQHTTTRNTQKDMNVRLYLPEDTNTVPESTTSQPQSHANRLTSGRGRDRDPLVSPVAKHTRADGTTTSTTHTNTATKTRLASARPSSALRSAPFGSPKHTTHSTSSTSSSTTNTTTSPYDSIQKPPTATPVDLPRKPTYALRSQSAIRSTTTTTTTTTKEPSTSNTSKKQLTSGITTSKPNTTSTRPSTGVPSINTNTSTTTTTSSTTNKLKPSARDRVTQTNRRASLPHSKELEAATTPLRTKPSTIAKQSQGQQQGQTDGQGAGAGPLHPSGKPKAPVGLAKPTAKASISHFHENWVKLTKLDRGAFGVIWTVQPRDGDGEDIYVLKELDLHAADHETRQIARTETILHAKCSNNPYICSLIQQYIEPNAVYMILEYCPSGSMWDLICHRANNFSTLGYWPEEQIMWWFCQLVLALEHVHSNNIVHLDIKPANLLLAKDWSLRVCDFGLSVSLAKSKIHIKNTFVGTPAYASPEQMQGLPADTKTDVWAIGVILYMLCTLNTPFGDIEAKGGNNAKMNHEEVHQFQQLRKKILTGSYKPLPSCYSRGMHDLLSKLLAKKAKFRPSMAEILKMPYVQKHLRSL